jgi:hypothetical protein
MIQKQISLPEKLDRQIKQRAQRLQEPEEWVIRDLLYLGLIKSGSSWRNSGDALRSLEKLGCTWPDEMRHIWELVVPHLPFRFIDF